MDKMIMPANQIPSFRVGRASERGVLKNVLLENWGGIGDLVCAEPTLRYCLETFKDVDFSLITFNKELFGHLPFKEVFDIEKDKPDLDKYLKLSTIRPTNDLQWEFMSHMVVNCIDYPSLSVLRGMIPIENKPIKLSPSHEDFKKVEVFLRPSPSVVVHPGKHWPSKTFPKDWWDEVLDALVGKGLMPIIIGADLNDNRSTVDVDTRNCLDLRGKLSLMESTALLQRADLLLTNDSAPLHLAASGPAWIGYFATVKHPDFITHWRGPNCEFGWKMKNLSRGGLWQTTSMLPNTTEEIVLDQVDEGQLRKWLPAPNYVAQWVIKRILAL